MDFAALMSKEIAKAKGGASTCSSTKNSSTSDDKPAQAAAPKYISKREAEEQRRRAYLAEQQKIEEQRAQKAAQKRKREEEAAEEARQREERRQKLAEESRRRREAKEAEEERARRKRLGLPEVPIQQPDSNTPAAQQPRAGLDDDLDDDLDGQDLPDLPDADLIPKLRELGEPATLFAETHEQRLRRYHRSVHNQTLSNIPTGPIRTTLRHLPEKDLKVPDTIPPASDRKARRRLYRQLASYFNMVLREWESALAREEDTGSVARTQAINAMIASKEAMVPLFRRFESGDFLEDKDEKGVQKETILEAIVEIVRAAQERRYVDANDCYLRLSIGKAAWPIGVTMVGIHERSAREKLHHGAKGHIMGGEVTRKYLQSIKRCLTFAQVRWPPEDIRQLMG
ncbi:hypothetical protein QBC46DRAFT_378719 [Diplogelasinospora grovesii]|uniref:Pre-mRNA-splicing factor 18 n=1 Tax=Diplogelasinospora grovesii TaxID=303347 RepID=A0AAN6NF31_9PEZI|nr:hypothetical protein QBC46DRAFT_378719 [Diplogelasinospora grovesii]